MLIEPKTFPLDRIRVFTSTREGGVSEGGYESLNTGLHVNDCNEKVIENRRLLFNKAGVSIDSAVYLNQTHSTNCHVAKSSDRGRGAFDYFKSIKNTDGIITNEKDVAIVIQTADCLPVVMYDKRTNSVSNLHCGWRSLADGIIERAYGIMNKEYNTLAKDLLVYLSACIGGDSYEVGADVAAKFTLPQKRKGSFYISLQDEAERKLMSLGILKENIEKANYDTFIDSKLFFSYRRDGAETGRMSTVAILL